MREIQITKWNWHACKITITGSTRFGIIVAIEKGSIDHFENAENVKSSDVYKLGLENEPVPDYTEIEDEPLSHTMQYSSEKSSGKLQPEEKPPELTKSSNNYFTLESTCASNVCL